MVNNLFENIIIKKDLFFKSIRKKKNSIAVSLCSKISTTTKFNYIKQETN